MTLSPDDLKASLRGLLAFSLTPFTPAGKVAVDALREQVEMLLAGKLDGWLAAA